MWTLIIISHILMFVSFMMLTISIIQGHFFYNDFNELKLENFSIYSVLVYVFTQTLVLFLIILIHTLIIELRDEKYIQYKKKMHTHTSLNLVFIATLAILFSAVHQKSIPENVHNLFFIIGIIHYAYAIKIQYVCFKEISKLIVRLNKIIFSKL